MHPLKKEIMEEVSIVPSMLLNANGDGLFINIPSRRVNTCLACLTQITLRDAIPMSPWPLYACFYSSLPSI